MSQEILNIVNSSSQQVDPVLSKAVRSTALAFASLDTLTNQNSYVLQTAIPDIYNGIGSGLDWSTSAQNALDLYSSNLNDGSRTLIFNYLGLNQGVNGIIDSINIFTETQAEALKCSFNALFLSCNLNNLTVAQTSGVLAKSISYYNKAFSIPADVLSSSLLSTNTIGTLLSQNYASLMTYINGQSPKNTRHSLYSYSYYDTKPLFSQTVDYQLMNDSEAQYYYVSGQFIYDQNSSILNPCIKNTVTNQYGTFQMVTNAPCVDADISIAPINGLSFYRKFVDAPNSSGVEPLRDIYSGFNIAANPELYFHSSQAYADPSLTLKLGSINSDLEVFKQINSAEIQQVPNQPQNSKVNAHYSLPALSGHPYSSSHIGGTNYRWKKTGEQGDTVNGVYRVTDEYFAYLPVTGFKIIPLSLDKGVWGDLFSTLRTNPDINLDNQLIRALSFTDYLSAGAVGGPIVSNSSFELPCIYINEELFNKTLTTQQSGSFYFGTYFPGVNDGYFTTINGQYITGIVNGDISYKAGETGAPKLNFKFEISNTGFSGANSLLAQKCFGMGGSTGEFKISGESFGNNLGYPYNDFTILSGTGNAVIPIATYLNAVDENVLGKNGSPFISYVDGYSSILPSGTQKLLAYNQDGKLFAYNYFYPGVYGSIVVPTGQPQPETPPWNGSWSTPFPVPYGAETLTPVLKSQRKENYLPRYSKGPYSSTQEVLLYPSASGVNLSYSSYFPLQLEVNLSISEEIARKIVQVQETSYINGSINLIERNLENEVFNVGNASFNFNNDLVLINEGDAPVDNKVEWSSLNPVPNYWVDSNFYQTFYPENSIKDLFTGLCTIQGDPTGVRNSSTTFSVASGFISYGNYNSGHYVIEYATGYYRGQPTDTQSIYRIQEDSPDFGYFIVSSGKVVRKLNITTVSYDTAPPNYAGDNLMPIHDSFYHSGGSLGISGSFGINYINQVPVRFNLERDCDSCEQFYLKYGANTSRDDAGCKYLPDNHCLTFDVYPENTNSVDEIKSSSPIFSQGLRYYHVPQFCCTPIGGYRCYNTPKYELRKVKTGPGALQFYYEEMPKYDADQEFHYTNGKNVTLTLRYTLPEFSLYDKASHPEYADASLQTSVPYCYNTEIGSPINLISSAPSGQESFLTNRNRQQIIDGYDPIWFEKVGGNSGISGGYHSKNIVGDAWLGFLADSYGISLNGSCPSPVWWKRTPAGDNNVLLINARPGAELNLHTRALQITPGYYDSDGFQNYDLTGIERSHPISLLNNFTLESLLNYISTGFQEYSKLSNDYFYPKPGSLGDGGDISKLRYTGTNNEIKTSGVYAYWVDYLKTLNDPYATVTGVKYLDKSRINFKINSFSIVSGGPQPLDINRNFRLTGKCVVSGEFGYDSQAESAVYTEGLYLQDHSENYPLTGFYVPKFLSDVMLRIPSQVSGTPEAPIKAAPSRCLTRANVAHILVSGNQYVSHLNEDPYNYNKFIVPAMSDLTVLNIASAPEEAGLEKVLDNDGFIYPNSTFLLSASIAQHLGTSFNDSLNIPNSPKLYYVQDIKQFYDSSVTDAVINSGYFVSSNRGTQSTLDQNADLSGFWGPANARYNSFKMGIYKLSGST